MRVFPDTNVLVSAFATRGLCADVLRLILSEHDLVLGEVVLTELRRILSGKLKLPPARCDAIEDFLREYEVVRKPRKRLSAIVRDAADRWVLATAVAAKADVLVTGDRDLLEVVKPTIRILTPREFWALASAKTGD